MRSCFLSTQTQINMEHNTVEQIKKIINQHEKSIHIYHAGDEAEKIAQVINHYERKAAEAIGSRKQMIEDTLVYFRSVVMITESIGMAGTHAEKAARLRGLIELLQSAISKLKQEKEEDILNNWRSFSWDFSTYPYQSILEKFDDAKRENERLKSRLAELENGSPA